MNPLELIDGIIDWLMHWRFNLCFWGGMALGIIGVMRTPDGVLQWVVLGFWVIAGIVAGCVWECRSG